MRATFDHLVIAAASLDEGMQWVARKLGAEAVAGGEHPLMGTHNALLSLGAGAFLEVIAIDPNAGPPSRPRWFSLDTPAMRSLLARGPSLIHWVERVDDIEAALRDYPERVEVLDAARRHFRWRIGVPADGRLPGGGKCPTLIQWLGSHPAEVLPPSGCELVHLRRDGAAVLRTPAGERMLPWRMPE